MTNRYFDSAGAPGALTCYYIIINFSNNKTLGYCRGRGSIG